MAKFTCNFISYTLKRAVDITVIMPTVTIPESMDGKVHSHIKEPVPVLYLLHGYGNNHATWGGYSNVEMYAEERQIAVVMISAENKNYVNHGGDDNYYDFISHELHEFVKGNFNVSQRKEDTFICGLSMGGFGALYHGLTDDKYGAIGGLSGAVAGMFNYDNMPIIKDIVKEKAEKGDKFPPVYIACGNDDFLIDANRELAQAFADAGADITAEFVDGYAHEWRFWNLEIERFLDWLPRTDPYANQKRGV